ncbi:MAG: hypothetical protein WD942_06835 [Dehalococcoidia bacterium]
MSDFIIDRVDGLKTRRAFSSGIRVAQHLDHYEGLTSRSAATTLPLLSTEVIQRGFAAAGGARCRPNQPQPIAGE